MLGRAKDCATRALDVSAAARPPERAIGRLPGCANLRIILNKQKLGTRATKYIEQAQILGQKLIVDELAKSSAGGRL